MKNPKNYQEWLIEQLKNPDLALAYLNAVLEENLDSSEESQKLLFLALRNINEAQNKSP